jgi:hypothetical protein
VARLEKKFEDVLGPLLRKNYIKVETYYEYSEKICRTFETILVNVDVILMFNCLLRFFSYNPYYLIPIK